MSRYDGYVECECSGLSKGITGQIAVATRDTCPQCHGTGRRLKGDSKMSTATSITFEEAVEQYPKIPALTLKSLLRYGQKRIFVGSHFLKAILANDLINSVQRADKYNREALADIADFMWSHLPMKSWGSKEIVMAWLEED